MCMNCLIMCGLNINWDVQIKNVVKNVDQCIHQASIFTFNKHFDKENDCVYEPVITKPHHWVDFS